MTFLGIIGSMDIANTLAPNKLLLARILLKVGSFLYLVNTRGNLTSFSSEFIKIL